MNKKQKKTLLYSFTLITILFELSVLSLYSQQESLQENDEKKYGFEIMHTQKENEDWKLFGEEKDYIVHLGLTRNFDDFSKLMLIPCFVYESRKPVSQRNLNFKACYARYSKVINLSFYINNLEFFYKVGGGYGEGNTIGRIILTGDRTHELQAHGGLGISYKIWGVKLFAGISAQDTYYIDSIQKDNGYDLSSQIGIDFPMGDKLSGSLTYNSYFVDGHDYYDPISGFYFAMKLR